MEVPFNIVGIVDFVVVWVFFHASGSNMVM
jgi:hypothetical protein